MILENKNDWIRQILTVGTPRYIANLECLYLQLVDAKHDTMSFNMHNGDGKFTTLGIHISKEWRQNMSKASKGKVKSDMHKAKIKIANQRKSRSEEYLAKLRKPKPAGHGAKVSAATKGIPKSISHCEAMSLAKRGKATGPCSIKRKEAIRAALKGKHTLPLVTCPHCGLIGRSNMHRWHFENCKKVIK